MEIFSTASARETQEIGAHFAKKILRGDVGEHAVVLGLKGNLGSGKTTFLQGFARGLGIEEAILSPTFVIMKRFAMEAPPIPTKFKNFYHFDCYRLEVLEDVQTLEFGDIIADPKNIVAIEWPENIAGILPAGAKEIIFTHLRGNEREIKITRPT